MEERKRKTNKNNYFACILQAHTESRVISPRDAESDRCFK